MDESGLYGYEDEFIIPDPDMVPVMPDDNPGRTVDEMLALPTMSSVTVKKAVYSPVPDTDRSYEQAGRFGSKEKTSLRKGLNVPESGIVYGSAKRRNAEEIRSLDVQKREKDEIEVVSEQEFLAQIIAPKLTEVKMIEVVPALPEVRPAETTEVKAEQSVPVAEAVETAAVEEAPSSPVVKGVETAAVKPLDLVVEPVEKAPVIDVTVAPLVKEEPEEKITLREIRKDPLPADSEDQTELVAAETEEKIVLIPPVKFEKIDREEEPIVLIPPQKKKKTENLSSFGEERIVLIPPKRKAAPSVEVFLDE